MTHPDRSAHSDVEPTGVAVLDSHCDRLVDVMEELMKFTLLTRELPPYLVDRYAIARRALKP